MRTERLNSLFWLIVMISWILGFIVQRWFGSYAFFIEISKAVRVNNPIQVDAWWKLITYFALSPISIFALTHIFFGVGGTIFLFARGMYDGLLINQLETTIRSWTLANIPIQEVLTSIIIILILAVNLPLCIWAGHLGIQRSFYTLNRIRGKPVNPEFGSEPLSKLINILVGALLIGLIASVIFSYI